MFRSFCFCFFSFFLMTVLARHYAYLEAIAFDEDFDSENSGIEDKTVPLYDHINKVRDERNLSGRTIKTTTMTVMSNSRMRLFRVEFWSVTQKASWSNLNSHLLSLVALLSSALCLPVFLQTKKPQQSSSARGRSNSRMESIHPIRRDGPFLHRHRHKETSRQWQLDKSGWDLCRSIDNSRSKEDQSGTFEITIQLGLMWETTLVFAVDQRI